MAKGSVPLVERLRDHFDGIPERDGEKSFTRPLLIEAADLIEALVGALEECANDLEAEVQARWGYDPRLERQLNRDMAPVVRARAIIATQSQDKDHEPR